MMNQRPEQIADAFAAVLRDWLTPSEFAQMVDRNENDAAYANGACASHDFCDANMAMDEAFEKVVGRHLDVGSDADTALWNEAWEIARRKHIGEPRPQYEPTEAQIAHGDLMDKRRDSAR